MRNILILLTLFFPINSWSASMDADGDGESDPTIVVAESSLDWKAMVSSSETTLAEDFGALGDHLMPGHYTSAAATDLAFVKSSGRWRIKTSDGNQSVDFGIEGASYIGGADFDGDGKDDIAYRTNACSGKKSSLHVKLDPLNDGNELSLRTGRGRFYGTYGDVNGDGSDEFCFLRPKRSSRQLTGKYLMKCVDVIEKSRVLQFNARKVHSTPLPIKQTGSSPDLFAFVRSTNSKTIVIVRDVSGSRLEKIKFNDTGTIVIGNFTNDDDEEEQIGLYKDSKITVWDLNSHTSQVIDAPNGVAVDEININDFENDDSCFCNSAKIRSNGGSCKSSNGDTDNGPGMISGACNSMRDITDGSGNFLHKPVSENNSAFVNLFPRSDDPSSCWYENKNNQLIGTAYSTGYSNPDRPTFRPDGGKSCGSMPSNFIIACNVRGTKACWQIPNPCSRYD